MWLENWSTEIKVTLNASRKYSNYNAHRTELARANRMIFEVFKWGKGRFAKSMSRGRKSKERGCGALRLLGIHKHTWTLRARGGKRQQVPSPEEWYGAPTAQRGSQPAGPFWAWNRGPHSLSVSHPMWSNPTRSQMATWSINAVYTSLPPSKHGKWDKGQRTDLGNKQLTQSRKITGIWCFS